MININKKTEVQSQVHIKNSNEDKEVQSQVRILFYKVNALETHIQFIHHKITFVIIFLHTSTLQNQMLTILLKIVVDANNRTPVT